MGGSALLIFAVEELSKSVQYIAGSRFRTWINHWADNRLAGMGLGVVLSLLLSSSGAVTVMLVGLANARLMSLEQVFSVTLGASIGTTFILHIFAFRVSQYGLLLITIGIVLEAFSKADRLTRMARAILFLGLMFFSMGLIVDGGQKLEQDPLFRYTVTYFKDRPIFSLLIATSLTAVIHSSAATIAFVMSMMVAKQGDIYEAIPWILGANLGTTTTAYFASFRGGALGKQAALGNLLSKLVGVALVYPLAVKLGDLCVHFGGDVSRQIAYAHTLFNVFVAIIFFPFVSLGVHLVRRLLPDSQRGPFSFQYLDPKTLDSPELALAQAQREILRMSDTVEQMVDKSIEMFHRGEQREIEALRSMDQVVDYLNKGIKLYLTKLSQKEMTPEQVQKEFELVIRTNDMENIGDIIDKNILDLVRKSQKKGSSFSKEGWEEIQGFHRKVVECLRLSTAYFNSSDRGLLAKLTLTYKQIEDLTLDLTEQHMQRLHRGVKETQDTTSLHLDLLGNLQRIAGLSINFTRVRALRSEQQI